MTMSTSKQKLTEVGSDLSLSLRKTSPSPQSVIRHRRSQDSNMTSSQESLTGNVSGSGKEGYASSSAEKEDGDFLERLTPAQEIIEEREEENSVASDAGSCSWSSPLDRLTENDTSLLDSPDSVDLSITSSSCSSPLADRTLEKKQDSADSTEKEKSHTREKSFERSLDNIIDKCSEKSLDLNLTVDSLNGSSVVEGSNGVKISDSYTSPHSSSSKCNKTEKKKKSSWYTKLNPTYKSRSEDFKKIFKDIPNDERLIVDYSCALQKDILVQGRMYISQDWVCFYANIFRWETVLAIPCKEITAITKEKTARVIPNAIQITTEKEKYFFTSFGARDKTFMMLFRIWQNALLQQPMNPKELWQWIHYSYGDELGLTSEDEDYVPPPGVEDLKEHLQKEEMITIKENGDLDILDDGHPDEEGGEADISVSDDLFGQAALLEGSLGVTRGEVPTDLSDTTEDSEGEVTCTGHDHLEKLYLDEVFNMTVDKMFECLFTNSHFFRQFVGSRKTFDLNLPPWSSEVDGEGNRLRHLSYTLSLNHSIGPKTSPSTEKQICYKDSQPNVFYIVDAECCNGGIPYADSFFVINRYCLTRVSKSACRLRVTSVVRYRKSVFGIVRTMIERSAVSGLTDYFRSLSAHLRKEAERQETPVLAHQLSKKKLRKRRKQLASSSDSKAVSHRPKEKKGNLVRQPPAPPSPVRASSHGEETMTKLQADALVRVICVILILLVMFNAVLFYKLWSLESYTSALYYPHTDGIIDNFGKHPRTQDEWIQLLKQQRYLHESEIDKWHQIISTSIKLIDQMRETLVQLSKGLEQRTGGADTSPYPDPQPSS